MYYFILNRFFNWNNFAGYPSLMALQNIIVRNCDCVKCSHVYLNLKIVVRALFDQIHFVEKSRWPFSPTPITVSVT